MSKPRIVNVIPLARLRNDMDFFSYLEGAELDTKLAFGDLVQVPFRNQLIDGIVFDFPNPATPQEFKLKNVFKKILSAPFLQFWQLDLIKYMSKTYLVSMATIAKMIVPEIPKRQKDLDIAQKDYQRRKPIKTTSQSETRLCKYRKFDTLLKRLEQTRAELNPQLQMVIIVPELQDVSLIADYFTANNVPTLSYLQDVKKSEFWKNWHDVSSGKAQIIVGTRSAIFAPFFQLGHIALIDEEDESHKQEEPNPRYRVHEIANFLAENFSCPISLFSMAPSIEALHKIAQKEYLYTELDKDEDLSTVSLVDMNKEFLNKNFSIISSQLQEELANLNDSKALLYLDRKGFFTGVICRDCHHEVRQEAGKEPLDLRGIVSCANCRGNSLRSIGKGVKQIAEDLKLLYPKLRINTYDSSGTHANEELIKLVSDNDLIITTNIGLRRLDLSQFKIVASLSADLMMMVADFSSAEKVFSAHFRIAAQLGKGQQLFIQTRNIDHYLFTALYNHNLKFFYLEEIKERKKFSLPPFSRLVKIIYRNSDKIKGQKELDDLMRKLTHRLSPSATIYPPREAYEFERRGTFNWQIILKFESNFNFSPELAFLREYSVTIDTEPNSLR